MTVDFSYLQWNEIRQVLSQVAFYISTVFVVFGGLLPYWFQYREILRTQNARGFSLYVCLTLLAANIARVMFWLGKRFEIQLLFQSLIMILCMLLMIELAVRVNRKHILPPHKLHSLWDGEVLQHFWQWTDFSSYLLCSGVFTSVISILTYIFITSSMYVEMLGFIALLLEAMIGAPQLYNNWQRQSTIGMSVKMVLMWLTGDIAKTIYFIVRHTPAQFWLCGILQVGVDIFILVQVAYYRRKAPTEVAKAHRRNSVSIF